MKIGIVEPILSKYLHTKALRSHIPLSGTFEVSPICNMNCEMCYVKLTKEEQEAIAPLRSKDEWLQIAREAKRQGMLFLLLTGGEPFLYGDFKNLYIELQEMGFMISINSNATMIDKSTIAWLREYPPYRMNITIYGASDMTYDLVCSNPRGFTQLTQALDLLRDEGISVKLNCSVLPQNKHDLTNILDFAESRDLTIQVATYMFPSIRKCNSAIGVNNRLQPLEAAHLDLVAIVRQRGQEYFSQYLDFLEKGENILPESQGDCVGEGVRCRGGKTAFWITWDGRMLPCGMINCPVTFPFKEGFDLAWSQLVEFTGSIRLSGSCAACGHKDLCRSCAAMAYTEAGAFDAVPEYRCQMTKGRLAAARSIKEKLGEGVDITL